MSHIKQIYQQTEYTCGTTCAAMVINYVNGTSFNGEELFDKYIKDPTMGTLPIKLKEILSDNNVKYTCIKEGYFVKIRN